MRIFLYEFVTGGGWLGYSDDVPPASLLAEGDAMIRALAADFAALEDTTVAVMREKRLPAIDGVENHLVARATAEMGTLETLAAEADWTVLIAPEFDGQLLARTRAAERAGGKLLSPSSQVVSLAGDKQAMAECLARHGVPVPRGMLLEPGEPLPIDFPYPGVLKPRDGAGSLGVERVDRPEDRAVGQTPMRLERLCPGAAASVACLCGVDAILPLEPCLQNLSGDGTFSYRGGSLPIDVQRASRARRLAQRTIRALPNPTGYVGIDLVLADDPTGAGDVVIEVNPRLTTSYVGLRALCRSNLAAAMIAVAQGHPSELCWSAELMHFSAQGVCTPGLGGGSGS